MAEINRSIYGKEPELGWRHGWFSTQLASRSLFMEQVSHPIVFIPPIQQEFQTSYPDLIARQAKMQDATGLIRVLEDASLAGLTWVRSLNISEGWERDFIDDFHSSQKGLFLVLEKKDLIIGNALITFATSFECSHAALFAYLVMADKRDESMEMMFVEYCCNVAKACGLEKLKCDLLAHDDITLRVMSLCGFKHVGTLKRELEIEDKFVDVIVLEKII